MNTSLQKCGLESDFKDQYTFLRKFLMTTCESTELHDIARLSTNINVSCLMLFLGCLYVRIFRILVKYVAHLGIFTYVVIFVLKYALTSSPGSYYV